ncbi:MAG: thiamine phosphate synthase [Limisphaerales bacterium]
MKPLSQCRLYTFVDTAYLNGRDPVVLAKQLCDGGSDIIQLRAKNDDADEVRRLADKILPITTVMGVPLVINDHPKIALQLSAPVCHLGQEDFFDAGYRSADQVRGCPPEMALGLSTHAPEQAERALRAGPDYIAIGPVFATPTKPGRPPVTLEYVRWAKQKIGIPWFAIGGITLDNLDEVLAAGARRICVVSAILNAEDVAQECGKFRKRIDSSGI